MKNSLCLNPATYVENRWECIRPTAVETKSTAVISGNVRKAVLLNSLIITKDGISWNSSDEIQITNYRAADYNTYLNGQYLIIDSADTARDYYIPTNSSAYATETEHAIYHYYTVTLHSVTKVTLSTVVKEYLTSSYSSTYPTITGNYLITISNLRYVCHLRYMTYNPPTTTYPVYYWEAHKFTPGTEIPATTDSYYEIGSASHATYDNYFHYWYVYSDKIQKVGNNYYFVNPTYFDDYTRSSEFIFGNELTGKFFSLTVSAKRSSSSSYTEIVNYSGFGGYSLEIYNDTSGSTGYYRIRHNNKPNFYAARTTYPGRGLQESNHIWCTRGYGPTIDTVNYSIVSSFNSASYSTSIISGAGQAKIGKPPFYTFNTTTVQYNQLNDDVIFKGVSYENTINSNTDLTVGNSANAKITFTTNALTGSDLGKWFTWYQKQQDDDNYKSQGVYLITDVEHVDKDKYKVTAFDPITLFDLDVSDWIQSITFPITIGNLFEQLCSHVGAVYTYNSTDTPNINNIVYENVFGSSSITARNILEYIAAITSTNAAADSYGRVALKLIPQDYTETFEASEHTKYKYADYNVPKIESVKIATNDEDTGIVVGNGLNVSQIQYSPLFYSDDQDDMVDTAQNILDYLNDVNVYRPGTLETQNDKGINVGDRIRIATGAAYPITYYDFIVFSKSINSSGITFICTGNPSRDTATSQYSGSYDPNVGKYSRILPNATGVEIVSGQRGYRLETKEITTKFTADDVSIVDTSSTASGTATITPTKLTINVVDTETFTSNTGDFNDRLETDYISAKGEQYWNYRSIYKQSDIPNTDITGSKWFLTAIPTGIITWNDAIFDYEVNDLVSVTTGGTTKYYICKEYHRPSSTFNQDIAKWTELVAQTWYELVQGTDNNYWAQSSDPMGTYANDEKFRASKYEVLLNNAVCGEITGDSTTVGQTTYNGIKITAGNYSLKILANGIYAEYYDGQNPPRTQTLFT